MVSLGLTHRYYRWSETNEMVVLKSAGLSGMLIARPGLVTAALFARCFAASIRCG
jgi:lipopolysaccharide export LptBFGC system permease protein LptF